VGTAPLPVTLIKFAAFLNSDQTVGLSWATAQEVNSDYYEVERSPDGENWTALGQVKAKGFSSIVTEYGFTDSKPLSGTGYYRLKMVDMDGKYQLSKVVSINVNSTPVALVVYSNPFIDDIRLKINTSIRDNLALVLTDMQGKIMLQQNLKTQAGDNMVTLHPGNGAAQGIYILRIQGNTISQTLKLVKQQ
jgi:hypothetical protein